MGGVAIVCDSTSDLGLDWFEANNVVMVPLKVVFGEDSYLDWIDLNPADFYDRLTTSGILPKTSQPAPADFAAAYEKIAQEGYDSIVSIHLSSPLSGTVESANTAASQASIPVRIVDTLTITSATGLAVSAAVKARDAGATAEGIESAALRASREGGIFFVLDTLEYLVKGGRAGKASGLAAAVLNIKAVLTVNEEGIIEPFAKAKGMRKAMGVLAKEVADISAKQGTLCLALFHACSDELVDQLKAELDAAGADYEIDGIYQVGAVIGTYAGPRAVGCAYYPKA